MDKKIKTKLKIISAKSIQDSAWNTFANMLDYKLKMLGRYLIEVNPRYTSQKCSKCGVLVSKSLSVRTHICPECGFVGDRDWNAALNILKLGQVLTFGEDSSLEHLMTREACRL